MLPGETANLVTIPVWPALSLALAFVSALVGLVAWVFVNFERKVDAAARYRAVETQFDVRTGALETRVAASESLLGTVARDVAYIRGRMEPKA